MGVFQNIKIGSSAKAKDKPAGETDLQKLRRVDLLELLLDQTRQNEAKAATIEELTSLTDRLKAKLDEKDAQIERLKTKLDQKDAQIVTLEERVREAAASSGDVNLHDIEVEELAVQRYLQQLAIQKAVLVAEEKVGAALTTDDERQVEAVAAESGVYDVVAQSKLEAEPVASPAIGQDQPQSELAETE